MASGVIDFGRSSTTGRYLHGKIEWSSVADNSINNDSDVTVKIYVRKGHNDYTLDTSTSGTWSYNITINGDSSSGTKSASVLESFVLIAERTLKNVAHNSDGSKSIVISGYVSGPAGTSFSGETTSGNATVALDTIPRATTIAAGRADIGSALLISTNRKNKSFTHSLQYVFGNLNGYIDAEGNPSGSEVKLSNETPWFYLPEAFYGQIPNSPEGVGTLYCRTYSGNTQIGQTQPTSFTAVVPRALCSPELTWGVTDTNEATVALTGSPDILVKGHSVAHCEMQGIPKNSAQITYAAINGQQVTLNTDAFGTLDVTPQSGVFSFYVKDSRGYDCTVPAVCSFVDYIDLTCNVTAARTDPTSGNAVLNIWGKYFGGSFTAADNTLSIKYRIGNGEYETVALTPGKQDYSVSVPLEELDYQNSYTIQVVAQDRLMSVTKTVTLGKGIPVFDWGENDFVFHVPVAAKNGINGVYLDQVNVYNGRTIRIRTAFPDFTQAGTSRQTILIFGWANGYLVNGVLLVNGLGDAYWHGEGAVSFAKEESTGILTMTLPNTSWDWFTGLSARPFSFL